MVHELRRVVRVCNGKQYCALEYNIKSYSAKLIRHTLSIIPLPLGISKTILTLN